MGGGIRHTLAAGTEFNYQETDNTRFNPRFNDAIAGPSTIIVPFDNPANFTPVFFNNPNRDRHTELEVASFYVQDQLAITRYLDVIGGLRFDRFDLAFDNGLTGESLARVDDVWSPRLGFVFKPTDTVSLYVSHARSFLPSAGDQFNVISVAQSNLEPEEFENKEIGLKWEVASRLFLTGALYKLDRSNQVVASGPFAGTQVGLTRTKGGELGLTGYVTDQWQVSAGWGHQIAEVVQAAPASIGNVIRECSAGSSWRSSPSSRSRSKLVEISARRRASSSCSPRRESR